MIKDLYNKRVICLLYIIILHFCDIGMNNINKKYWNIFFSLSEAFFCHEKQFNIIF